MTTKSEYNFDQEFYENGIRNLTCEAERIEARFKALGKALPPRPSAASGTDLIAAYNSLAGYVASLKELVGTLPSSVHATVAAGIVSADKVKVAAPISDAAKISRNLTERVLKARGVIDIAQLPPSDPHN